MIVVSLTDCPSGLRGDLTKWLLEISPCVFVGQVSARVRDELWERICHAANKGRVSMVFSANNEQQMDFRIHNGTWQPIDFDGLKLMLQPATPNVGTDLKTGFSDAAKRQIAKKTAQSNTQKGTVFPADYVAIDIETTGLSPEDAEIIELSALAVENHQPIKEFSRLIKINCEIPSKISELTGITNAMTEKDGVSLPDALQDFFAIIGTLPLVSHNIGFDYQFLKKACADCGLPLFENKCIDTLTLAKRRIKAISRYKLGDIAEFFGIKVNQAHRSANDCETTYQVFEKLINFSKIKN